MNSPCKICRVPSDHAFEATVRGKYHATYHVCPSCGFLFVPEVPWLAEAYSKAIADTDVGLVKRNLVNRRIVAAVAFRLFGKDVRILDVAGGYGLLTRLLRDAGFDAWSQDDYCENLFAELFTPQEGDKNFDLLTAFEVFEHLPDPVEFLQNVFKTRGRHPILFSTLTHHGGIPPSTWHYYAFESGQHIAFYTDEALQALAARFDLKFCSLSDDLHFFCPSESHFDKRLRVFGRKKIFRWYMSWAVRQMKKHSLLAADAKRAAEVLRRRHDPAAPAN